MAMYKVIILENSKVVFSEPFNTLRKAESEFRFKCMDKSPAETIQEVRLLNENNEVLKSKVLDSEV